MKFCALASGSSGNCQYIEHKDTKILVDAGLTGKKIEENLKEIDVDPSSIDAIFVTHEHIDHIKAVGVLSRRYDMKIFSNLKTLNQMLPTVKKLDPKNVYIFENNKAFEFKDIHVDPIDTFHDCIEGCGFVINALDTQNKISIMTDTGWVNSESLEKMEGSDIYYIEANHDKEMLLGGRYSWSLKQRIMSTRGHLSNENTAEILQKLLKRKKENIVLAHLSKDNNLEELAKNTVVGALLERNLAEERDYTIEVAKRDLPSQIYKL